MPEPPGRRQSTGEGEGGASNKLRIAMEKMDVGKDNMDMGEEEEAVKENVEEEGGVLWGVCWNWKPQGS